MIIEMVPDAAQLRDHWWWRPGWSVGRRRLAWHLTVERQSDLHLLVAAYQEALAPWPTLEPVPLPWLHMTLVDVGPVADVSQEQVADMIARVSSVVTELPPLHLAFARLLLLSESACLLPEPAERIADWRDAVDRAVHDARPDEPRPARSPDGLPPHLSIAYANGAEDGAALLAALRNVDAQPSLGVEPTLSLIEIHRDNGFYEWRTLAALTRSAGARTER